MNNQSGTTEQTNNSRPSFLSRQQESPAANGNSQEGAEGSGSFPAITLPKGGGAIQGMGEKFSMNPVTGSGSMSVPIAVSPGHSGFSPQLSWAWLTTPAPTTAPLAWDGVDFSSLKEVANVRLK